MIFKIFFLLPLFLVGTICAWTDIKDGKIKNKWIGLGFIWALILYAFLFVYNYFFLHQLGNVGYVGGMMFNGFVALGLGYILWSLKLLAAGDAKLFALYAFLIPPEFYSKSYFWGFPSFILLINIFIPLLLFLVFKSLIFTTGKVFKNKRIFDGLRGALRKEKPKETLLKLLKLIKNYAGFVLVLIILQLALSKINLIPGGVAKTNYSAYFFIALFFIYKFVFGLILKHKLLNFIITLSGLGASCYLILNGQTNFLLTTIKIAIIFMVFVSVSQKLLTFYIDQRETKIIESKNLGVGMFPYFHNIDNNLRLKLGEIDRSGLTQNQVDLIKEFLSNHPGGEIKIYKTFALAPFILLGAVISVWTSDSFISLIVRLVSLIF